MVLAASCRALLRCVGSGCVAWSPEHTGFRSCRMWTWLLCDTWDLSSLTGNQTATPALQAGLLIIGPPGKSHDFL